MKLILTTARFLLREMEASDLDFLAGLLSDPQVMRHYPKIYTREEAAGWLERTRVRYAQHGHGLWLVEDRASREPLGQVGLCEQQVEGRAELEIGYMVASAHWKRGIASEAAAACRDHAFRVLHRDRVISLIRPDNMPSQAVARKIGMQPEKTVVHWELPHLVFSLGASA